MTRADDQHELAALALGLRARLERELRRGRSRIPAPKRAVVRVPQAEPDVRCAARPRSAAQATAPPPDPQHARSAFTAQTGLPRELAPACANLEELQSAVARCTACNLCETRKQTVFADGSARAQVMFIGEAPGADEDDQGVPFVGRAGQLLTDIITKGMKMAREDVYIANVLKCRPPGNRDPETSETQLCTAWLDRQIELVNPRVLITLGRHASQHILSCNDSMGRMRGRVHVVNGRQVVPTYHPAYLLRSPEQKSECWKDIRLALEILR